MFNFLLYFAISMFSFHLDKSKKVYTSKMKLPILEIKTFGLGSRIRDVCS